MAYAVAAFLAQAALVSLSGVMAPGPATAATVAAGVRRRHAGAGIAVGHALIEVPLIVVLVLGAETVVQAGWFRVSVGLAGGAILLLLAGMTLADLRRSERQAATAKAGSPVWTGMMVTGGNPYFLLWWATVGLALATRAIGLGLLAFALFVVVHWLCDLVWLEVLSQASHKGVALFGQRGQQIITIVSAVMMGAFGLWFVFDAGRGLMR